VPADVVTVMSTAPGVPVDGDVAVICVAELTVVVDADVTPNFTVEPVVKFVPVITTEVPPPTGPELVPRLVTVGALVP